MFTDPFIPIILIKCHNISFPQFLGMYLTLFPVYSEHLNQQLHNTIFPSTLQFPYGSQ